MPFDAKPDPRTMRAYRRGRILTDMPREQRERIEEHVRSQYPWTNYETAFAEQRRRAISAERRAPWPPRAKLIPPSQDEMISRLRARYLFGRIELAEFEAGVGKLMGGALSLPPAANLRPFT